MGAQSSERHFQNHRTRRAGFDMACQVTTPYAAAFTLGNNHGEYVPFDVSGGGFTITLPANPYDGMTFHFSEVKNSANNLVISGNGKNINGAATLTMGVAYRQRKLRYSSMTGVAQWIVIGGI
jgi:hypothetical protein